MTDQDVSGINVTCSSDTPNPRFTKATVLKLMLERLDVLASEKEATLPLVCRKKGKKGANGDEKESKHIL